MKPEPCRLPRTVKKDAPAPYVKKGVPVSYTKSNWRSSNVADPQEALARKALLDLDY